MRGNDVDSSVRTGSRWSTGLVALIGVLCLLLGIGVGSIAAGRDGDEEDEPVSTTLATATTVPPVTSPPAPREVVTFAGSSDRETETFQVSKVWRLSWNVQGQPTPTVTIMDAATGQQVGRYHTGAPGDGDTLVRKACTCYLVINVYISTSTWRFTVTDLPA